MKTSHVSQKRGAHCLDLGSLSGIETGSEPEPPIGTPIGCYQGVQALNLLPIERLFPTRSTCPYGWDCLRRPCFSLLTVWVS